MVYQYKQYVILKRKDRGNTLQIIYNMRQIEDKYKVLTQLEHVLHRPNTYIGSNKPHTTTRYVYDEGKMLKKEVTYISSFLKIFDEVITNSVDEHKRNPSLNKIEIYVDKDKGTIKIKDNGGLPVILHKDHNMFVPEIVFGTLLSSSNYNDDEDRIVAGTNGLGVKCTNIFSKEFIISTCDGKNSFLQIFSNNMKEKNEPIIKKSKLNHTEITYLPDYERFGMEGLDEDHYKLLEKRVIDIAGCNPKIKMVFNGEEINFKSFSDYIKLYTENFYFETNKEQTWSIGVAPYETYHQVSFVNSVELTDGGTVVDYVLNQIISELRIFLQKKHKVDIKPSEIKNHIFLFLNTTIINPSFSSQTKEKLITEVKDFGFTYQVSAKLIKEILKSEIVETILDWIARKKDAEANKLAREVNKNLAKIKVDKLIDAKGKNRRECCICLFEGDSAASAFRTYRDPNLHGAFCLRGKFVNATDMTNDKLVQNKEVLNFMAAMGLRLGEVAEPERLRYGKILIFTDADFDGYSINGLLINFFWKYWPELFYHKMVYRVETPIVVSQNIKSKKKINFYTQEEYNKWLETITPKEWIIKYKKGLAALSDDEYEEIILKPRLMSILPDDFSSDSLNIWFGKDSELRKEQLLKLQ